MALAGALCMVVNALTGFTNRSLRAYVAALLGATYTASQMSYDLRRLRLHGLIERLPRSNVYTLTPDGIGVTLFYTKIHDRLLRPLLAADHPPAPLELRRALSDHRPSRRRLRRKRTYQAGAMKPVRTRGGPNPKKV